ncbi:unnamed protein product [Meloidogyne enterolobii]|uniref:Uncharacterized protein n=1 Tax=Meloidogyne enterolobii TaxID=390850 RepID=A0ACB0ZP64_MELEN
MSFYWSRASIRTFPFRKCLMSKNKIFDMMSWDKETLARVVKGFYVRIGARRPEKSSEQQFYVDQITGVSWGGTPYRFVFWFWVRFFSQHNMKFLLNGSKKYLT